MLAYKYIGEAPLFHKKTTRDQSLDVAESLRVDLGECMWVTGVLKKHIVIDHNEGSRFK